MNPSEPYLLADGHVHVYPCFDVSEFFTHALRNLSRRASVLEIAAGSWRGCLLLTESHRDAVFAGLAAGAGTLRGWQVEPTAEPEVLQLRRDSGEALMLISGFQVATAEDLEVLAIGTTTRVPDGSDLFATIDAVREAGAHPVIPWGFGKWTLQRGALIRELIERERPEALAFGDNGGRSSLTSTPSLLKLAKERGFPIVPGTDPLPFPAQARRAGTSGFVVHDQPGGLGVAARVRRALTTGALAPGFVSLTGPIEFSLAQVQMQIRKRLG